MGLFSACSEGCDSVLPAASAAPAHCLEQPPVRYLINQQPVQSCVPMTRGVLWTFFLHPLFILRWDMREVFLSTNEYSGTPVTSSSFLCHFPCSMEDRFMAGLDGSAF